MKRNHIAIAIALAVGSATGALLSAAVAQGSPQMTIQQIPTAPVVPVGVSGAGNFAWFLSGRTIYSCTAGSGSASPPVCNKGVLQP